MPSPSWVTPLPATTCPLPKATANLTKACEVQQSTFPLANCRRSVLAATSTQYRLPRGAWRIGQQPTTNRSPEQASGVVPVKNSTDREEKLIHRDVEGVKDLVNGCGLSR